MTDRPATDSPTLTVSVRHPGEMPSELACASWSQVSAALAPQDLLRQPTEAQWTVSWVVAEAAGAVVGLLPTWRSRRPRFSSALFDPATVAPSIFDRATRDARDYLLIGGATDLVAGYSVVGGLAGDERRRVGAALVAGAFAEAEARGLRGAALYVRRDQLDAFAGRDAVEVDQFAELVLPGRDFDSYVRALDHGRRSVVRRDLKRLDEQGLRGEAVPARDVVDEAAGLVVNVKSRHDVFDHPELAAMRLNRWAGRTLGQRLAFTVRDAAGELLAVSFGCLHGDVLELYEIGLAEAEQRHLGYVEALVYAPLRFAADHGCRLLQLGLGSSRPKTLRGATLSPVSAVGVRADGDHEAG